MLDKPPVKVSQTQIISAKVALDAARRIGDTLHTALAEDALNDLLDRYSSYTSNALHLRDKKRE